MRFYRSKGRIWTGTQADAKTAQGSNDYETIDVPTDKPTLLPWLNTFVLRPGEEPAAVEAPTRTTITATLTIPNKDGSEDKIEVSGKADPVSAFPLVEKHPHKNRHVCNAIERVSVEEIIWDSEEAALVALESIIRARRGELAKRTEEALREPESPPAPRPRVRTRVQPAATEPSA